MHVKILEIKSVSESSLLSPTQTFRKHLFKAVHKLSVGNGLRGGVSKPLLKASFRGCRRKECLL